ncbi:SRPBCC family protein [Paeniglutamicibacter sp. MACA_103]|uniref:SRPBCC family protein n=1 Tax=Paeniglutamicibacter sp. MACA_103 TaxID=3377337 RepID=UPI003893E7F8
MAWQRTQTHFLALPPATLWEVLRDPARVPEWHRSIARLRPHDVPARAGTLLDLLPAGNIMGRIHGATAPPAVLTHLEEGTSLTWRQPQPGGHLLLSWSLREVAGGTELTQRVSVTGSASAVFARFGGKPIASNFAEHCARLYALAGGTATQKLRIVIAGGHGFLGARAAADLFCRGHEVVILTRNVRADSPFTQVRWDGKNQGPWSTSLYRAGRETAVLNLAGELVDLPPTEANIARLRDSRVDSTRALVDASNAAPLPLAAFLQSSTTAIFSDAGEQRITEDSPLPTGAKALPQMTGVARPWEEASAGANAQRLNILRTSLVFEQESPLVDRLSLLAGVGLGGPVAGGEQWVSWIHLADWLRIVRAALGLEGEAPIPGGVIHLAAPHPVRNREMMAALRAKLAPKPLQRLSLPTPRPVLAAGAVVLHTDPALGTTGRHVTSRVLADVGFEFEFPDFEAALGRILG